MTLLDFDVWLNLYRVQNLANKNGMARAVLLQAYEFGGHIGMLDINDIKIMKNQSFMYNPVEKLQFMMSYLTHAEDLIGADWS